jgi:hypothetical protein
MATIHIPKPKKPKGLKPVKLKGPKPPGSPKLGSREGAASIIKKYL